MMFFLCISIEFRIDAVLQEMSSMKLVELPEEEPWTVKEFLKNTEELCFNGARELQTKSVNVEVCNSYVYVCYYRLLFLKKIKPFHHAT